MKNVQATVSGDTLTLTVDLSKSQGRSSSGKSEIVATTSGSVTVETPSGPVKVGLNVYR